MTMTFKLTRLPKGYPSGFKFPKGMEPNMADYNDRGWCFCESSVSNLVKAYDFVLDLAKFDESVTDLVDVIKACTAKRWRRRWLRPSLRRTFRSRRSRAQRRTAERVGKLYEKEFDEKFGEGEGGHRLSRHAVDGRGVAKLCGAIATASW